MQNAAIVIGALLGIFVGVWLASIAFNDTGGVHSDPTTFFGALPGAVIGGWIASKLFSAGK